MILVFSSMFFALLVGIPAGILLSRPAARGIAEYVMQIFTLATRCRRWPCWRWRWW